MERVHTLDTLCGTLEGEEKTLAVAQHVKTQGLNSPLILMDLSTLDQQYTRWSSNLPNVQPFYAVKANDDVQLLRSLASKGCNFDCASMKEIELVLKFLGMPPSRVVFSNPCKLIEHIRYAREVGVTLTVADDVSELRKLAVHYPQCEVLLRLAINDESAFFPMGYKFGASLAEVPDFLNVAKELKISLVGVHFHIGSGFNDISTLEEGIKRAKDVFEMAKKYDYNMTILDLGGGIRPELDSFFEQCTTSIKSALNTHFSDWENFKVIAEPGRFFCDLCSDLVTTIHSVKAQISDDGQHSFKYYVDDGVWGTMNPIIYPYRKITPFVAKKDSQTFRSCIFGPTCDAIDTLIKEIPLPKLVEGDMIIWPSFGAYSTVCSTLFNGFSCAKTFYYRSKPTSTPDQNRPCGFQVAYAVEEIPGKGKGLVAKQFIPAGTLIWIATPEVQKSYTYAEALEQLAFMKSDEERGDWLNHVYCYGGFLNEILDDCKRCNHSRTPVFGSPPTLRNLGVPIISPLPGYEGVDGRDWFATRDVSVGEEITDNYETFENPDWYVRLCKHFNVEWAGKVAELYN